MRNGCLEKLYAKGACFQVIMLTLHILNKKVEGNIIFTSYYFKIWNLCIQTPTFKFLVCDIFAPQVVVWKWVEWRHSIPSSCTVPDQKVVVWKWVEWRHSIPSSCTVPDQKVVVWKWVEWRHSIPSSCTVPDQKVVVWKWVEWRHSIPSSCTVPDQKYMWC